MLAKQGKRVDEHLVSREKCYGQFNAGNDKTIDLLRFALFRQALRDFNSDQSKPNYLN